MKPKASFSGLPLRLKKRQPLADITNSSDLRKELRDELDSPPAHRPALRIFHDRHPSDCTQSFDKENAPPRRRIPPKKMPLFRCDESASESSTASGPWCRKASRESLFDDTPQPPAPIAKHNNSSLPQRKHSESLKSLISGNSANHHPLGSTSSLPSACPLEKDIDDKQVQPRLQPRGLGPATNVSVSSNAVVSTSHLQPHTHKVAYGQVVILPSRSILVDFREGERRKGRKGNEVLVVSPDGLQIQIFSAPHLSTPCCLAEPTATYALNDLPAGYRKLYDVTSKVIEHLKRKIPKLTLQQPLSVCTLMANGPQADIEVKLDLQATHAPPHHGSPSLRVLLSRKQHKLELVSYVARTSGSGSEQSHKTLFWNANSRSMNAEDLEALTSCERDGVDALTDFLRVVEALEDVESQDEKPTQFAAIPKEKEALVADRPQMDFEAILDRPVSRKKSLPVLSSISSARTASTVSRSRRPSRIPSSMSSKTLSELSVAPRPRFSPPLNSAPDSGTTRKACTVDNETTRKASSTVVGNERAPSRASTSSHPQSAIPTHGWGIGGKSTDSAPSQMRFIPAVGWCMRHAGVDSGNYRIMFLDGVALEIDIDKERITFTDKKGESTKYTIRDCHAQRMVSERMKVFEEFVSMFDESDD